jgi:hypothetical protein
VTEIVAFSRAGDQECDSRRQDSADSCGSLTTRKLLTDMECGAYNSDSLGSPSAGTGGPSGEQVSGKISLCVFIYLFFFWGGGHRPLVPFHLLGPTLFLLRIKLHALICLGVSLPSFDTGAWNGVMCGSQLTHYSLKKFCKSFSKIVTFFSVQQPESVRDRVKARVFQWRHSEARVFQWRHAEEAEQKPWEQQQQQQQQPGDQCYRPPS